MRSLSWKLRQCGVHGHFILATSAAWLLYGLHWEQHVDGAAVARLALGGSSAPAPRSAEALFSSGFAWFFIEFVAPRIAAVGLGRCGKALRMEQTSPRFRLALPVMSCERLHVWVQLGAP